MSADERAMRAYLAGFGITDDGGLKYESLAPAEQRKVDAIAAAEWKRPLDEATKGASRRCAYMEPGCGRWHCEFCLRSPLLHREYWMRVYRALCAETWRPSHDPQDIAEWGSPPEAPPGAGQGSTAGDEPR